MPLGTPADARERRPPELEDDQAWVSSPVTVRASRLSAAATTVASDDTGTSLLRALRFQARAGTSAPTPAAVTLGTSPERDAVRDVEAIVLDP